MEFVLCAVALTLDPLKREQNLTHVLRIIRRALHCSVKRLPAVCSVSVGPENRHSDDHRHKFIIPTLGGALGSPAADTMNSDDRVRIT